MTYFLALKAEALYLADRTSEALETIGEAEALAERSEERWWCAELHRLRSEFLAATGADDGQCAVARGVIVTLDLAPLQGASAVGGRFPVETPG